MYWVVNTFRMPCPQPDVESIRVPGIPYIYTHAQVIGKLVGSIMNSPVP